MDNPIRVVVIVVIALAVIGFGIWGYLRWRYVKQLRDLGWEFDTSPNINHMIGLNHAPFGAGFDRKVDDLIYGTAPNGVQFKAIEYDYEQWGSTHYVLFFPLPKSLPFLYVRPLARASRIPGKPHGAVINLGQHEIIAGGDEYGHDIGQLIVNNLGPLAAFELSIDHANLVVFDVAEKVDDLKVAVNAGSQIAAAVASACGPYSAPPAPNCLSFNRHPHWTYIPRDDSYLSRIHHTTDGYDHEASNIVFGERDGISFLRLTHSWKTRSTDSEGRTTVHHHEENLCDFWTGFRFGPINLGSGIFGFRNDKAGIQFELMEFNRAYKVTAADKRFAYDVLHQRMMRWLLDVGAPKFEIHPRGSITVRGFDDWRMEDLEAANALLHDFFARVPDVVWKNLGVWPRPVARYEWV
ncbi:hypothetical protein [uncultured Tessaracoccus sp.]|uniref:hypothetical protein n=1 Tax=uncultured Tessaracoccus sp. TaxID=905023 RepID=UPI00261635CF|nr:hypothetical protein [uncultured Tessaracoccus sp.]